MDNTNSYIRWPNSRTLISSLEEIPMRVECPNCNITYGRRKGYAIQCKKCGKWLQSASEKKIKDKNYGLHKRRH